MLWTMFEILSGASSICHAHTARYVSWVIHQHAHKLKLDRTYPNGIPCVGFPFVNRIVVARVVAPSFTLFVRILCIMSIPQGYAKNRELSHLQAVEDSSVEYGFLIVRCSLDLDPIQLVGPRRSRLLRSIFEDSPIRNLVVEVLACLIHGDE